MNDTTTNQFDIARLTEADADDVAAAHALCFEGYFLTELGRSFLRRFYAAFCRHDFDYGVVARCRQTNRVAAFVVGTSNTQAHFRSFYRRNMIAIPPIVLTRFLTRPIVRGRIWQRAAHIRTAVCSVLPMAKRWKGTVSSSKGPKTQCPARLLSIGVLPEFRGSGLAASVIARFEEMLRRDGHERIGLSVLADNERAISFYKKVGWEVTYASDAGWWFERDL